ncbi:UNVERIFIED_CONTAM: hypothetical protein Cloal_0178 [Acetivibrio alkalicellulosi]
MHNNKKRDELFINRISPPDDVKKVSKNAVGNADKDPFCVYNNQRHAVGSVIEDIGDSKTICNQDGSWQNSK